jgi:hypothetical protein
MTASQSGKSARYARCLSTGHGKARSDIKLKSQVARQFAAFDATNLPLFHQPLHRQPACRVARSQSHTPARGAQIPIAPAVRPYVP